MIVSKYEKSYDTADGSEQHYVAPRYSGGGGGERVEPSGAQLVEAVESVESTRAGAGAAGQRWEDDGGPPLVQPPISPLELSAKPGWSVLSLRDLNQAIRLEDWPENPTHRRRQAEDAESGRLRAIELEAVRMASRARADRNRHRNPWENT